MAAAPHGPLTTVDSSALVSTGISRVEPNGDEYIYAKGVADTAAGSWVAFDTDGTDLVTALLTETIGAGIVSLGVAMAATIADTYGWYCVKAMKTGAEAAILAATSVSADAPLYCTTTAGSVDDSGTTPVHGVRLTETAATAGNYTCLLDHPHT